MMIEVDVCILGAGQAAMPLARKLDAADRRVAIVERSLLGGSCVNFGCTPSKAVIAAAEAVRAIREAKALGIDVGQVRVDFGRVMDRARGIVERFRGNLDGEIKKLKNVSLHTGHGRFESQNGGHIRVAVDGGDMIEASHAVIDTGTRSLMPDIEGIEAAVCTTAENWVEMRSLPEHVMFLGAGYIGLEMALFFRRMGADVTIIDHGKQVLSREDEDVARAIQDCLADEGVRFRLETDVIRFSRHGDHRRIETRTGAAIEGDCLFLATGREPNSRDLGLDKIGIAADKKGVIDVDAHLRTNVKNVFAVGDVRGGPMFTHTAWDDHRIVAGVLLGDGKGTTTGRVIPYGVFVDPELGRVGMTEREAREAGKNVRIAKTKMADNSKAIESGQTNGFVKLVIDADTDRLLGAAVLATGGAELVGSLITLMNADAPLSVMRDAIYIHPTLTQALQSAALQK